MTIIDNTNLVDTLIDQIEDFIADRVMAEIWPQKLVENNGVKRQVNDDKAHTADEIAPYANNIDFTGLAELDNITYALDSWFGNDDDPDKEFTDAYPEIAKALRNGDNVASDFYDEIMNEDGWGIESMDIVRNVENALKENK